MHSKKCLSLSNRTMNGLDLATCRILIQITLGTCLWGKLKLQLMKQQENNVSVKSSISEHTDLMKIKSTLEALDLHHLLIYKEFSNDLVNINRMATLNPN
jgi:hypothetical protein